MLERMRHLVEARWPSQHRQTPRRDARLDETVDRIAQIVSPKIKAMHDYRRRLREPVQQSLDFFRQAANSLVGPVVMEPGLWRTDPLLNACFSSMEQMSGFLRNSESLRRQAAKSSQGEIYFLLTMDRREESTLGCVVECEVARRDVLQTVVTFSDHRAHAPAATLEEARETMARGALEHLAARARAHIVDNRKQIEELERARAMLKSELKLLELERHGLGEAFVDADMRRKLSEGEQALHELASNMAQLRSEFVELADYLEFAVRAFEEPGEFVTFSTVTLVVNRQGIKDYQGQDDPSRPIRFSEIRLADRTRAAFVARCSVADVLADPDRG
ncbi:hypothetical protein [Desulfocurvibacter africanus]|uniref:Uncharacterized protein n=1 Tax=Desulfocurvibacter africanus subsp. africanus str. Walvis Bay TaxID=690850 RepID=F3Z2E3_DESAF|nr:hypothetical protein [Desulfocurvibacter africanus]EGJ50183.1 hypothetical protein Desaf_1851 [Desulfocurvibacter africanus subsp. africanus str. Walvis Bay]